MLYVLVPYRQARAYFDFFVNWALGLMILLPKHNSTKQCVSLIDDRPLGRVPG